MDEAERERERESKGVARRGGKTYVMMCEIQGLII